MRRLPLLITPAVLAAVLLAAALVPPRAVYPAAATGDGPARASAESDLEDVYRQVASGIVCR
jgi:hypothetical protein